MCSKQGVLPGSDIRRMEATPEGVQECVPDARTMSSGSFALRLNKQLGQYISWTPDLFAMATDTLQISWVEPRRYAISTTNRSVPAEEVHGVADSPML